MIKETYKLLLKKVKEPTPWGEYEDKEEFLLGEVAFPFKGKTDDREFEFKKGDQVYYQFGTSVKLKGEQYVLVSLTSLICPKS